MTFYMSCEIHVKENLLLLSADNNIKKRYFYLYSTTNSSLIIFLILFIPVMINGHLIRAACAPFSPVASSLSIHHVQSIWHVVFIYS